MMVVYKSMLTYIKCAPARKAAAAGSRGSARAAPHTEDITAQSGEAPGLPNKAPGTPWAPQKANMRSASPAVRRFAHACGHATRCLDGARGCMTWYHALAACALRRSAVTRNYSEKVINKILDLVSGSQNMELLQEFYETTLKALQEAKNDRLWCATPARSCRQRLCSGPPR